MNNVATRQYVAINTNNFLKKELVRFLIWHHDENAKSS